MQDRICPLEPDREPLHNCVPEVRHGSCSSANSTTSTCWCASCSAAIDTMSNGMGPAPTRTVRTRIRMSCREVGQATMIVKSIQGAWGWIAALAVEQSASIHKHHTANDEPSQPVARLL